MTTFNVTNTNDSGTGSLRQAISDANNATGADTIEFDNSLSGQIITLSTGELTITDDLTINGLGAEQLTINAAGNSGVFNVDDGNASNNQVVSIDSLTITGGSIGGIFNTEDLSVSNSTISGNSGGGIFNNNSNYIAEITSTIIAENDNIDISGSFTSGGNNLIGNGDGGNGFTNGVNGDIVGSTAAAIDPLLGPLQDNGGPTFTQALLSASPAIDAGSNPNNLSTDQRGTGFDRVLDSTADIGAFELQVVPGPTPTPGNDNLTYDNDDNTINALAGNDTIRAGGGDDNVLGSGGADRLFGQNGNDTLNGGASNDRLIGGNNRDSLIGGNGNDVLNGGNGNDTLIGGNNRDALIGGNGNDVLNGGNGKDTLTGVNPDSITPGFEEVDILRGNGGVDLYVLGNELTSFYVGNRNADRAVIQGFEVGVDEIQLFGTPSDYLLQQTNNGSTRILENTGSPRDLVGVVQGVTALNLLDSDTFSFV